jgi:hypothetical protein
MKTIDISKVVFVHEHEKDDFGAVSVWLEGINDSFSLRGKEAEVFLKAFKYHDPDYQGRILITLTPKEV